MLIKLSRNELNDTSVIKHKHIKSYIIAHAPQKQCTKRIKTQRRRKYFYMLKPLEHSHLIPHSDKINEIIFLILFYFVSILKHTERL